MTGPETIGTCAITFTLSIVFSAAAQALAASTPEDPAAMFFAIIAVLLAVTGSVVLGIHIADTKPWLS